MNQSEALTLVARLFGFFPAGAQQRETVELYASKLVDYPADVAARAINEIIDTRHQPFAPTWAEILDAIRVEMPRPRALPEPDGVPPSRKDRDAIAALMAAGEQRTRELQNGAA